MDPHDVAVYESAEQLLARFPELSEPGCVLLDVVMPGLSGPELRDRLRKLGSALAIVSVTGRAEPTEGRSERLADQACLDDRLLEAIEDALRGCAH